MVRVFRGLVNVPEKGEDERLGVGALGSLEKLAFSTLTLFFNGFLGVFNRCPLGGVKSYLSFSRSLLGKTTSQLTSIWRGFEAPTGSGMSLWLVCFSFIWFLGWWADDFILLVS